MSTEDAGSPEDRQPENPIGPLPRSPCTCGFTAASFMGSLSVLKDLVKEGDKKKVSEQLMRFVVPNQADFNETCFQTIKAPVVSGAADLLVFDIDKPDWKERILKDTDSLELRVTERLQDCIKIQYIKPTGKV